VIRGVEDNIGDTGYCKTTDSDPYVCQLCNNTTKCNNSGKARYKNPVSSAS
jgi:hypothetical protein